MRLVASVILGFLWQSGNTTRSLEDRLWHHRNLGKAFYENPTTQAQAVEEFRKALDLAPNSGREQLNHGLALLRAGKTAQAVAQLENVQKGHPRLPHTWFNLGIAYKKDGDFARAQAQFEKLLQLAPREPVAHYNLGVLYKAGNHIAEAVREFEITAKLNPNLAAPHFQLYNLYRAAQRNEEAARRLREFQRLKKEQEGAAIAEDMEWCDYAEIHDPVDALPPGPAEPPRYSERTLGPRPGLEPLRAWKSVAPGDYNNDGRMDLAVVTASGVFLCENRGARFQCSELLAGAYESVLWIDYDHDYDLDLVVPGAASKLMRNQGAAGFTDHTSSFPFRRSSAQGARLTRLAPDSKAFDMVVDYADGSVVYRDRLNGRYEEDAAVEAPGDTPDPLATTVTYASDGTAKERTPRKPAGWIGVQLAGVRNLKLAQGAEVEVRAGLLHEKKFYRGVPLLFDLRGYKEADTVRITWPNGLIQNEIHQAGNKAHVYREAQRLSGSCPMIWSWNGREFEFLTDVLGVAPLGAASGDGSYFPVDHDEYVLLPAESLRAKDGELEIRVTEELSEVTYLDQVQLYAVDHPASTEVFLNEKWKAPPFPDFRFYGAGRRIYPVAAADDQGDVLPLLLRRDRRYPGSFRRTEAGVASMHELTLDFARAAADNRAVLILNGWVDWADGSTFLAAAQESKAGLVSPYLQVKDERGEWKTVIEDMGIPDGKPKTIAVDLSGRFLSASRQVRIVTNLCVYWDEIFLSESSAAPHVRQARLPVASAELRYRGFSPVTIHPERLQPEQFFYAAASPVSFWNPTPGLYTRYGDVRPLVDTVDDMLVIMGSGDEMRLRFDPSDLPAVQAGWDRQYMLKVDGWAKDRDANTAYSQTVDLLPFHGMSRYPYAAPEEYPRDAAHRRYREQYNTRPALRLLRPLAQGAR